MAKNDFQYGGWNSYTLQCGTIMTLISPGDCTLQCGMWLWNRDSEFTKWQQPAMWYSSGIMTLNLPGGSTLQCSRWLCDEMPLNSPKRPPYWSYWFRFRPHQRSRHVILHHSPKFYPNRTTLGRKRWRHVDFKDGESQPSWILGIQ